MILVLLVCMLLAGCGGASRLPFGTAVDPGSGTQFRFRLAGEAVPRLDDRLSAGGGPSLAWPSPAVLAGSDGGRRWRRSLSAPTGFWGLDFLDAERGWAVGVTALYRTRDGGRVWQRVAEPGGGPRRALVRVAFTGARDGFGLTAAGRLVQTVDGGASWHAAGWAGRGGALCVLGRDALVVADQRGAIWLRGEGGHRWRQVAPAIGAVSGYAGWWVDLSCQGSGGVALAQAHCMAACGGGVVSHVRETTDAGVRWRQIARPVYGPARESAPVLARVAAVGERGACLVFEPTFGTDVVVRCTGDGGRSFSRASLPVLPGRRYADVFVEGVSFVGAASGRLVVAGASAGARPRTEVWSTGGGVASWTLRSVGDQ
ncbi:MAG TPA: YCF48-related protein [Solirubrobacteraceae bacterium]|nr:YCF48-related protein [Solirubrobacteraceae bacterium]